MVYTTQEGVDENIFRDWLAKMMAPLILDKLQFANFIGYTLDNYIAEAHVWLDKAPPSLHEQMEVACVTLHSPFLEKIPIFNKIFTAWRTNRPSTLDQLRAKARAAA